MTMLGTHAGYIVAAYGFVVAVIVGLVLWVALDGRGRRRELADLEARGIRRRSESGGERR